MHSLKRLFFWLSGAGTESLEACPNWEQRKYVAFGATVLVPSVFAFIACSYALSTLTDNAKVIYAVALVWAFIILTIDRALLASYRPYLGFFRKISQFSLRFVVALLMGLTISHPLTLLLFRDTIQSAIEKDRRVELASLHQEAEVQKDAVRVTLNAINDEISAKRRAWDETFQAKFLTNEQRAAAGLPDISQSDAQKAAQAALDQRVEEEVAPLRERIAGIEKEMAGLQKDYTKIQTELDYWQKEFERELNGQRSGIVGLGPRAKSVQNDQLAWRREEAKRISGVLEQLTGEKNRLRAEIAGAGAALQQEFEAMTAEAKEKEKAEQARLDGLRQQVQQEQADQFVEQQNTLRATLSGEIDAKVDEMKRLQGEIAALATAEQTRAAAIEAEPRRDILTQTLALHELFRNGQEGGSFALAAYVVLTLLFMLVDTIPLIVKFFSKPGPYDTLLDQDEVRFDRQRQQFLVSYDRFMKEEMARSPMYFTRNRPLEGALAEGVEYSKAAKQFLESLMEMERAFEERMRSEHDRATAANTSTAMLEQMTAAFYRDLQRRMETFFHDDRTPSPYPPNS